MSALASRVASGMLFLAMAAIASGADIPYLSARVVDDAEILSSAALSRLTTIMREHEQRTTNQIAVLTVPTIQGESIEEYSLAVFEKWKLGQRGKDNGVLLVVVPRTVACGSRWATVSKARSPISPPQGSFETS